MFETCRETVSILWALVFGAGDACVSVSMWSVIFAILPFAAFVFLLQYIANTLLFGRRDRAGEPAARRRAAFRPKPGQRVAKHLREAEGD